MSKSLPVYRIKVKTTNGMDDTCCNRRINTYFSVQNGEFYLVTDQIHKFVEWLGDEITAIERVGIGYRSIDDLGEL